MCHIILVSQIRMICTNGDITVSLPLTRRGDESFCQTEQDVLRSQLETRHGRNLQKLSRKCLLHQWVRLPLQLSQTCNQDRQSGTCMAQSWRGRMDRVG